MGSSMKEQTKNRVQRLEAAEGSKELSWSMSRVDGVLTGADGQTMTDEEYLRRVSLSLPVPLVWDDEKPSSVNR